jgi:hypothetical protein
VRFQSPPPSDWGCSAPLLFTYKLAMAKGMQQTHEPSLLPSSLFTYELTSSTKFPPSRGAREGREGHRRWLLFLWSRRWGRYHDEQLEWHHYWPWTCRFDVSRPACSISLRSIVSPRLCTRIAFTTSRLSVGRATLTPPRLSNSFLALIYRS